MGRVADALERRLAQNGLACLAAFDVEEADAAPPGTASLVLVGPDGGAMWAAFCTAPEARDGRADPLDRWSRRVIGGIARACGGAALFPFEGPPFHPFIRWARRAPDIWPSRLGLLIHAERGLWIAFRAAIALPVPLLPAAPAPAAARPCDACAAPCLSRCPVDAFTDAGFDAARCRAHLAAPEGAPCREGGCLARRACPVGRAFAHGGDQAAFHMKAFAGGGIA